MLKKVINLIISKQKKKVIFNYKYNKITIVFYMIKTRNLFLVFWFK